MTEIQAALRPLGITSSYKGYRHACYSIKLVLRERYRLEAVTKEVYMETAEHYGCDWHAVERNIRTVVARAWMINPTLLMEIAGYPMHCAPTAKEFIEIMSNYIDAKGAMDEE